MTLTLSTGAQIHVEDTGAPFPDAETIVFGHGLLFSGRMYAAQVAALRGRYRCITIDWRGQGRSGPAPDGRYDMDALCDDLVALLDESAVDRVHYVGLSMGGFVGMRLAAHHPGRVQSLTLLDTSAGPENPDSVGQYKLLAFVYRWVGMGPVKNKVAPLMFGATTLAGPRRDEVTTLLFDGVKEADRVAMRGAILGVCNRPDGHHFLPPIVAPTLVVVGAEDAATPVAKSEDIVAGIQGARLEIVPSCGHSSTVECPEELTRLITEFVESH